MKKILVLTVLFVFVAGAAYAGIVGSSHDLRSFITGETSTQVCVYCHTPHQAAAASGQYPLWNKQLSTVASYGAYTSTTMNATPNAFGGGPAGSAPVSALCMSCHDGTVAVNSLYKAPSDGTAGNLISVTGTALLGTSLTDDHPVNFTFSDADTNDPDISGPTVTRLFNGTVQCASCHNVHDDTNTPFLRMSNANSALCDDCHDK